jgi:biopolymer transport protein ExbD
VRLKRTRQDDSTFDLNLAPFLDIIVSIIPMMLLSIAFVQVKMIEAPTPQVVSEQDSKPQKPQTVVTLNVSKKTGFTFNVTDKVGKTSQKVVAVKNDQLDYEGLVNLAITIKSMHPDVSSLQLVPAPEVTFNELVEVMDQVRNFPKSKTTNTSAATETKQEPLFPEVVFASIGG